MAAELDHVFAFVSAGAPEPVAASAKEKTMHLYETHIPVADTAIAATFYRDVIGLPFAYRDPTRDVVFLWVDEKEKGSSACGGRPRLTGRKTRPLRRGTLRSRFRSSSCTATSTPCGNEEL